MDKVVRDFRNMFWFVAGAAIVWAIVVLTYL